MTITLDQVNAHRIGALIALFERAVGFYASLVNINAYHQPGVEAGKKAAAEVLELQKAISAALGEDPLTVDELSAKVSANPETVQLLLDHLAASRRAERSDHGYTA
jgi:glucose-6-phosphate isomerase